MKFQMFLYDYYIAYTPYRNTLS